MMHKMILALLLCGTISISQGQSRFKSFLFVGNYTEGIPGEGIFIYSFEPHSGKTKFISSQDSITNPSYLTISPNGKFLYACTDTKLPIVGSITAFKFDSLHGTLSLINRQSSGGDNPVYLTVHSNGRFLVNANYSGGSVSVYPLYEDGALASAAQIIPFSGSSLMADRQEKSHIHSAVFSPSYDFIFLPDLGTDMIRVFPFDAESKTPLRTRQDMSIHVVPGSGPRHFTFHPNGRFAYCVEELSGQVSAYAYQDGHLDPIQRIFSYGKPQESYGSADIHLSPDGKFLYASNRWTDENTISIFSVDAGTGKLTLLDHQQTFGVHPRNFVIDPAGKFLLVGNMASNQIVIFKRNKKTGLLVRTKHVIDVPSPSCLQIRSYKN